MGTERCCADPANLDRRTVVNRPCSRQDPSTLSAHEDATAVTDDFGGDGQADETACTALISLILLLLRCGYSRKDLARLTDVVLASVVEPEKLGRDTVPSTIIDAAHVLTLWSTGSEYLLKGEPRELPPRGPAPSINSLRLRVNPRLKLPQLVRQLIRSGAVMAVADKYALTNRWMRYRTTPYHTAYQLRHTAQYLLNIDHNIVAELPTWFERTADCPSFPVSALPELREYAGRQLQTVLENLDEYMNRRERARVPGERVVRVGVGGYHFQIRTEEQSPEFRRTLAKVRRKLARSEN